MSTTFVGYLLVSGWFFIQREFKYTCYTDSLPGASWGYDLARGNSGADTFRKLFQYYWRVKQGSVSALNEHPKSEILSLFTLTRMTFQTSVFFSSIEHERRIFFVWFVKRNVIVWHGSIPFQNFALHTVKSLTWNQKRYPIKGEHCSQIGFRRW